ncbi:hypothetical protein SD71_07830 [Cohnella kolymensis]|uniref:Uncharacterized protein n=1 Tax=Cohnella kolymensis TaxID=1590652 RepID=A0ABR5A5V4_9BACL|nr:hypothetical protein [Cohnella kolymensis]KIL36381.1 hypothetical protein SD71_07830 [Cohnella kolymensis]
MSTPRNIDKEEMAWVKDFLILPVMLDYLEKDIATIEKSGLNTDIVLIQELKGVQSEALNEHILIKRKLKERGIKVYAQRHTARGLDAEYLCRGYKHTLLLLWGKVRTEVLERTSRYAGVKLTGN